MKAILVLLGVLFLAATAVADDEEEVAVLHGKSSGALGYDLKVTAVKNRAGVTNGQYRVRNIGMEGDILNLVPPTTEKPYWCLEGGADVEVVGPGFEVLWFVQDLDAGDQLSYRFDFDLNFVSTCSNSTPEVPFEPVVSGKFVGKVAPPQD